MASFPRRFLTSFLACEALMATTTVVMYLAAGKTPFGREEAWFMGFSLIAGLMVALSIVPICKGLRQPFAALVGFGLGLAVPIAVAWVSSYAGDESCWLFYWLPRALTSWLTPLEVWVAGVELSIPSAVAGTIVGLLAAKPVISPSCPASRHG